MAIRGNAVGESLSRTTGLPAMNGFTMMAWFRIAVDRNAVSTFLNAGAAATAEEKTLKTAADGTTLNLWNGSTLVTGGSNLTTLIWNHLAMVYDGTASPDVCRAYLNGALHLTADAVGLTDPTGKIWIGDDTGGEWLSGQYAAIKVYSLPMALEDIQQEMRTFLPSRVAGLNSWTPGHQSLLSDAIKDQSGQGNNWTQNGTLGIEAFSPPIPWHQGKNRRMLTTVAGGSTLTPGSGLATLTGQGVSQGLAIAMPRRAA